MGKTLTCGRFLAVMAFAAATNNREAGRILPSGFSGKKVVRGLERDPGASKAQVCVLSLFSDYQSPRLSFPRVPNLLLWVISIVSSHFE